MAGLDPDGAARLTPGPVHAAGWVAQPAAGGVAAVLVLKDTIQYDDLLTARMAVGLKHRAWRPAHQGHGSEPKAWRGITSSLRTSPGNQAALAVSITSCC